MINTVIETNAVLKCYDSQNGPYHLKLLDETVTELKGEHVTNRAVDTTVEILTSAYIDASYIKDEE